MLENIKYYTCKIEIIISTIIFKKNNIYIMNDKYIYVTSHWVRCFKMKIKLPKRFHNVDLKSDNEYKKWKKSEDEKFDNKITLLNDELWWNNLEEKEKKEIIKEYGTKEKFYSRRHYWQGYPICSSKSKYKKFNSFLEIKKFFEKIDLHMKEFKKSKLILK
jgi:hypothetical protein